MVSKFCSRSQGQPPGARSCAMISTRRAKASPGSDFCTGNFRLAWSVCPLPDGRGSVECESWDQRLRELCGEHPLQHSLRLRAEAVDVDTDQGGFFELDHLLRRA